MSSALVGNGWVRVSVVEDHVVLANRIGEGLRDAGFAVDVVYDGAAALQSTTSTDYDVVVLDRDLPASARRPGVRPARGRWLARPQPDAHRGRRRRGSGRRARARADDYHGKPFAFNELIARVRALGPARSGHAGGRATG
jgi:DNA-binding response OmpR family regulator